MIEIFQSDNICDKPFIIYPKCFLIPLVLGGLTFKSCVSHYFCATLQLHNSLGNWARELFKPSEDGASLLVWILKNWKVLDFCGRCHKWGRFRHFWPRSSGSGPQPQEPIFWLMF